MNLQTKSLKLLADGFAQDFVNSILESEDYVEFLQNRAQDFVTEHVPISDEDMMYELAYMLMERTSLRSQTVLK